MYTTTDYSLLWFADSYIFFYHIIVILARDLITVEFYERKLFTILKPISKAVKMRKLYIFVNKDGKN